MDIPAESCEGALGAARPFTTDIVSQYITADKPEVTATFTSQEVTTTFPNENTQTALPHTIHQRDRQRTDIRADIGPQQRPRLRIASRDKKLRLRRRIPPEICVHPHLETDRKYSHRDIFHAVQFLWNRKKLEKWGYEMVKQVLR